MGLLRTIYYCLKLRRHDKLQPERIEAIRQKKLRQMVRFAQRNSPFFAEHYRGIDPDAPDFSIQQLPPTTKEMLMENFDRVATDRRLRLEGVQRWVKAPDRVGCWYRGRFVVTTTSGTTGAPGYFAYDRRDWDWVRALAVTRGIRFKPSFFGFFYHAGRILVKKVRVALISVLNGHFITYVLFRMTPPIGKLVSRFSYLSVIEPVDKLVAELNQIQPNVLHCYPTMLEVLAHEQLAGRLRIQPWVLTCSSEPLTRPAREAIEQAFPDSPLYETYGTSEGINLASECDRHSGLHLNSDTFIVEPVDPAGRPVAPGQPGDKVYVSCLFARAFPILRYEIGDQATRLQESCDCGLPYPLIHVQGRTDDTLWVQDAAGEPVALPPIPFEALFLGIDQLVQYQLVQTAADELLVRFRVRDVEAEPAVRAELERRFVEYLGRKGVADSVRLRLNRVDEIARDASCGKVRQIVSLVERPYLPGQPLGDRRSGSDRRQRAAAAPGRDRRQGERRTDDGAGEES